MAAQNGASHNYTSKTTKRRRKSRKQLELRHLFCGDKSPLSSPAATWNQILLKIFFCFICLWLTLIVVAYSIVSLEIPMTQPMFQRGFQFMSKQVQTNPILHGVRKSPASFRHSALSADSISERVPLIDMRELSATLSFDNMDGGAWKQGWDVQPVEVSKERPLQVFIVPHSHCDPGWIKTFDDYFQSQTKQILSTVVEALAKDPRRKFIWAEISYFEWWWREQSHETQELTKKLLASGQLEFVTGGWVQPDEANTQLYAMEIQLQEGHDWIRQTFGEKYIPEYGWSIDPFGYSPTMAYLLKKYKFKAMLIQRVHYAVKKELAKRQHLEFMWRQTWDATGEHDIFCHVMPFFSYDVPHTCGPDPSVCCQFDFARGMGRIDECPWGKQPKIIQDANVKERSLLLLDQYRKKAALYRSNVVIAPLGGDFRYEMSQEAEAQYTNYQRMFDYINDNVEGIQIQFGTLSDYFKAAMGKFDPPLLKGSFFTYSDVNQDYWSGYYTSRVFDKALDRKLERVLFAATSLGATKLDLQEPRRALSLFQHHDGVTGTAKDHVMEDYARRIHDAIRSTQQWISQKIVQMRNLKEKLEPCSKSDSPRGLGHVVCDTKKTVFLFNPLDTSQTCGDVEVGGKEISEALLPCDVTGPLASSRNKIVFDPVTGLMTHPVREEWMSWEDKGGGAYLFVPNKLQPFESSENRAIKKEGFTVVIKDSRGKWKRKVVERTIPTEFGTSAVVIDFIYETDMQSDDHEWLVRFTGDIENKGVFHTDLNGFNFDTHRFRQDMPLQSQVFPMPTLASIEDLTTRMTILSEHAQGTASLRDSSIDVWLDRRISTDDGRGLEQGVMDNVPTRTRLRIILEPQVYDTAAEFRVTPLCTRMWNELNHPLEPFGAPGTIAAETAVVRKAPGLAEQYRQTVVPFVYMVYKRVDLLKKAMDSLLKSDFPRAEVPLIISHDGHFTEVTSYVESLKDAGFQLIQLFHPYSCSEHPDTFPGEDPKLNENFKGDAYGNPRSAWVTCCKHHFTWIMKTVYEMDLGVVKADNFLFMEEDYVVAPTIYSAIQTGLSLTRSADSKPTEGFFGLVLDTSDGFTKPYDPAGAEAWIVRKFVTGPMVLPRKIYEKILSNAKEYCTFDDYNWDWSIVHMQGIGMLPYRVLVPSRPQVLHIGFEGGMHEQSITAVVRKRFEESKGIAPSFYGTSIGGATRKAKNKPHNKGFGGWGHPADHAHCLKLLLDGNQK